MALNYLTYEVRRPPRWNTFVAGMIINVVAVLALIVLAPRLTTFIPRESIANHRSIVWIAPAASPAVEPPRRVPEVAKLEAPKLPPSSRAEQKPQAATRIEPPKVEIPKPELPKIAAFAPPAVAAKPVPPKEIKTNVFGAEKSEVATVHRPASQVQTGGFGDPNGIRGQGDSKRDTVTMAKLGSFDLPSGTGKGNGTGGSAGVSGTIRSAGFGDGIGPSRAPRERGYGGGVGDSGFGSPVAQGGGSARPVEKKPELQPVEILYKPRPAYTPEAVQQRVEGEVLLEVVFAASGSLHVNRVVKGLGYGLDDKALAAAQQIRFRPARRDGQPYDCAALVHMVFELAK